MKIDILISHSGDKSGKQQMINSILDLRDFLNQDSDFRHKNSPLKCGACWKGCIYGYMIAKTYPHTRLTSQGVASVNLHRY